MSDLLAFKQLKKEIDPHKDVDKEWFLSLLQQDRQQEFETNHLKQVLLMLRVVYIQKYQKKILDAQEEIANLQQEENTGENYRKILELNAEICQYKKELNEYKCFFEETYFARMDVQDDKEGYNVYYIGKKGDVNLEIVDWRAPFARRYYQKSKISFAINEYDYKVILRRALRVENGKLLDFKNEYLSVKDYLSKEEIGGRDEEIIFDPYLREIIKERKEEEGISDIIQTIQEKQFSIITQPERDSFVLQGCAGSGKTMILLHRLSYLLYNNEKLRSRDILVITPSNSFNDFINQLAEVLELEKVKTSTIQDYFLTVLEKKEINIREKIDFTAQESEEYLSFLYSDEFKNKAKKYINKVFDGIYGMFSGEECKEEIENIHLDCQKQIECYTAIKNASLRVRRAVMGEIKEKQEGGLYYTKPFRDLMNCVLEIEDFLSEIFKKQLDNQVYFYRRLFSFCKSTKFVLLRIKKVIEKAILDLEELEKIIEKECKDLKRYKYKVGKEESFTYSDRIEKREETLKEISKIKEKVNIIGERTERLRDFYLILQGNEKFLSIADCKDNMDLARFFYKNTVKNYKLKYNLTEGKMYPSDSFALCSILYFLGEPLAPRYSFVFVDEGQDISKNEYELLSYINKEASFNIYGDLKQNITCYRGLKNWKDAMDIPIYTLNQNYRNTNQIVEFVSKGIDVDMKSIGFDAQPVVYIKTKEVSNFFKDKKGLKAIILSAQALPNYYRKSYNLVSQTGKICKNKINIMTVYESKGLEFSCVAVVDNDLKENEKYIAYTRALSELAIIQTE